MMSKKFSLKINNLKSYPILSVIKRLTVLVVVLLMCACSGGGGDDNASNTNTIPQNTNDEEVSALSAKAEMMNPDFNAPLTNYFMDSPVEGLKYIAVIGGLNNINYTLDDGSFKCDPNTEVEFLVSDISIGKISCNPKDALVTPIMLAKAADSSDIRVQNIASLLQTMDTDQNVSNGIKIPQEIYNGAGSQTTAVDFSELTSVHQVIKQIKEKSGKDYYTQIVPREKAKEHIDNFLSDLKYDLVSTATYVMRSEIYKNNPVFKASFDELLRGDRINILPYIGNTPQTFGVTMARNKAEEDSIRINYYRGDQDRYIRMAGTIIHEIKHVMDNRGVRDGITGPITMEQTEINAHADQYEFLKVYDVFSSSKYKQALEKIYNYKQEQLKGAVTEQAAKALHEALDYRGYYKDPTICLCCFITKDYLLRYPKVEATCEQPPNINDIDNDGDGYTENQGDCDDGNPAKHPGATEICGNGIDEDCNGSDSACAPSTTYHTLTISKTGTGHGTTMIDDVGTVCDNCSYTYSYPQGTKLKLSAAPSDDSTFEGWSGGACSGTGDCVVTMNENHAVTATFNLKASVTWYKDADKDKYSDGTTKTSPTRPGDDYFQAAELTAISGDCDDNNAGVHPGATEICGNGIDEDCNGSDLACAPTVTDFSGTWVLDKTGLFLVFDPSTVNTPGYPKAGIHAKQYATMTIAQTGSHIKGTTSGYVMYSEFPEVKVPFEDKIEGDVVGNTMHLTWTQLAPYQYLKHTFSDGATVGIYNYVKSSDTFSVELIIDGNRRLLKEIEDANDECSWKNYNGQCVEFTPSGYDYERVSQ